MGQLLLDLIPAILTLRFVVWIHICVKFDKIVRLMTSLYQVPNCHLDVLTTLIPFVCLINYQVAMLVSREVAIASRLGVEVSVLLIVLWSLLFSYHFQFS